jgi:hypothetical protein
MLCDRGGVIFGYGKHGSEGAVVNLSLNTAQLNTFAVKSRRLRPNGTVLSGEPLTRLLRLAQNAPEMPCWRPETCHMLKHSASEPVFYIAYYV